MTHSASPVNIHLEGLVRSSEWDPGPLQHVTRYLALLSSSAIVHDSSIIDRTTYLPTNSFLLLTIDFKPYA